MGWLLKICYFLGGVSQCLILFSALPAKFIQKSGIAKCDNKVKVNMQGVKLPLTKLIT